jgi:transcriptional regulator with XRE-family HTH domain
MTERKLLKIFSKNIKESRGRHNWTQAELAEKVDISVNFLSDIENGRKWASPSTMVRLSEVFHVEVYELLKPDNILADDSRALLSEYTDDVLSVVADAISDIHSAYEDRLTELSRAKPPPDS